MFHITAQELLMIGGTSGLVMLPVRIEIKLVIATVLFVLGLLGIGF